MRRTYGSIVKEKGKYAMICRNMIQYEGIQRSTKRCEGTRRNTKGDARTQIIRKSREIYERIWHIQRDVVVLLEGPLYIECGLVFI
jgi:hypothetical protein